MVNPVTGPFTRAIYDPPYGASQGRDFYRYQVWHRQKPPFDKRLEYEVRHIVTLYRSGDTLKAMNAWTGQSGASLYDPVYNRAYSKLLSKIGDSAEWGAGIAEARGAIKMIADRVTQLVSFTRNLRKRRWAAAARGLGVDVRKPPPGWKRQPAAKRVASGYLEYSFGWVPLVGDIYAGIEVLQSPFKTTRVNARSADSIEWGIPPPGAYSPGLRVFETCKVQLTTDLYVSNPNLRLASQMGLLNPASVAWELVPFSFVVDWFVNVSDIIGSMTDFAGLTLLNPATTSIADRQVHRYWSNYSWTSGFRSYFQTRKTGINTPFLTFGVAKFGLKQASYALSLLVQLFMPNR